MTPEERARYWKTRALENWREAVRMADRAGWLPFGSHVDQPDIPLEFEGDDGGVPLWERPAGRTKRKQ